MKTLILTVILILCLYSMVNAQFAKGITIRGMVVDSVSNQALSYVTAALLDQQTNNPVKSTFSRSDGSFNLADLAAKPYKLVLVAVGYASKTIIINKPGQVNDLGRLLLSQANNQLKEVSVTAVRPLMKQEVDRLSYNVQADPENKFLNVLDMLRRVPLVSVDATDNIKLQGNTSFRILINGKSSAMIARSPADVLKAMPASNIQKIEVITTPPAKYDAEGVAGIINIITKKNVEQGYNGSFNARYNNVNGRAANLGVTVKNGKLGLGGYVGYNKQPTLTNNFSNITDNFGQSYLTQQGTRTTSGRNIYTSADLSYESDSLHLLTASFEYFGGRSMLNYDQYSDLMRYNNQPVIDYRSFNNGNSRNRGFGAGADYQLGFTRSKEQLLTISYKYNYNSNRQFNDVLFTEWNNYNVPNYQQNNKAGSKEHTIQVDYVYPLHNLMIEAGAKGIFRDSYSDYATDIFNAAQSQYVTSTNQTNDFDYQQNVYSLYNSYQLKFSQWTAKGGLRFEHTTTRTNAGVLSNPYSNVIPSLSIQHMFGKSSINLGYTDRIIRPGIVQLNPFVNVQNINYISAGNPDLRPVVSHSLELTYSRFSKGSFNVNLNYRFANNNIESVVASYAPSAISISTYQNIGKSKKLGIDVNAGYPITSRFNFSINSELMHVWLNGVYNGKFYNNHGYQGHTFVTAGYRLDKGYRLGWSLDYDSRYVLLQGRDNYYFAYAANAAKDLWGKKVSLSVSITNPFKETRRVDTYYRTAEFYQRNVFDNYARRFNISLIYKFGKLKGDIKKNQRGISNDDRSTGRGD